MIQSVFSCNSSFYSRYQPLDAKSKECIYILFSDCSLCLRKIVQSEFKMPMNAQKRVTLFECDNDHRLFRGIEEFYSLCMRWNNIICFKVQTLGRAQNKLELNTRKYICFIMINTKFMHQLDKKGIIYFTFHFTCISIYGVLGCLDCPNSSFCNFKIHTTVRFNEYHEE